MNSSAVVKDVADIVELARDGGRIREGDGGCGLKDDGGVGDTDVAEAATSREAGSADGGTCASDKGAGSMVTWSGASFMGVAKGSVSTFCDTSGLSPGASCKL